MIVEDWRIEQLRAHGAQIGTRVFLGPDVYIEQDFAALLTIEDGAVLARGVCILLHDSALNNVAGGPVKFGRVTLGRNCYIGANSTILCGVAVGAGAIVGAASLVVSDVPEGMLAYGHPARVQGSVADLLDKHRQERAGSQRFFYIDMVPWRERVPDDHYVDPIMPRIRAFLAEQARDEAGGV
ncbi:MAG: hypothetical protein OHK0022_41530 [Roseiflexaceae bacterium]